MKLQRAIRNAMKNRRYTTMYKVLAWIIIVMLVFSLLAQALVR